MMNEIYNAVSTYINTNKAVMTGNIAYENTPPFDSDIGEFARVQMIPADNEQVGIGTNGTAKISGTLEIDIFVEQRKGVGAGNILVDNVLSLFERGTELVNGAYTVRFEPPVASGGRDDGYGYYQFSVTCPWFTYTNN